MKKIIMALTLILACAGSAITVANAAEKTTSNAVSSSIDDNPYAFLSVYRISLDDLDGYTKTELRILRNAIYARHGYIFKSNDLYEHFSMFSWYTPLYSDVSSRLTAIENANVKTIKQKEKGARSTSAAVSSSNPFLYLSNHRLTRSELVGISSGDLAIMRNAIYARHGYIFKKKFYYNYFSSFTWYNPRYSDVSGMLSSIEQANVSLIKSMEK